MSTSQAPRGTLGRLVAGLTAPLRGAAYLVSHPSLWPLAAMPLLINVVVFVLVLWSLYPKAELLAQRFIPVSGWAHTILSPVSSIIVGLMTMILGALFVNLFGLIIAPLFNERLSARVEVLSGRRPAECETRHMAMIRLFHSVVDELIKWSVYFLCMAALLPLLLIPIAGHLAWTFLSSIVTFWFLGLEYMDYPMSRRHMRFKDRRDFCWGNTAAMLGLGFTVTMGFLIPLANFLFFPIAVVGGTLLFLDLTPD